jgi:CheY-like chemotaxis protein
VASSTWVKVVGFSDQERHSLNTLFRLSERHTPSYALWKPDAPSPPHVALIDVDSYEAGLEMASPSFNPNLKLICVGAEPPPQAWRTFQRPVDWNALVRELDHLFAPQADLDIDLGFGDGQDKTVPPGVKVCMLVGMTREQRLYLRSRLALAGLTEVDDAETAGQASTLMSQRQYELVVIGLELSDADPWSLVQALKGLPVPTRSVIVATESPTWASMERAEQMACTGLLEIPFNPKQVLKLLQQV